MNQHTPAQIKAIQTWTEQRDALLRDIAVLSTELEEKQKANASAGIAYADIMQSIAEVRGRLAELEVAEDRRRNSVSIEVAELEARKSRLEAECISQEENLNASKREQGVVIGATAALTDANDTMKDQAQIVKSVVSDIIETSKEALSDVKITVSEIRTLALEVIEKGNENVKQTQIVIDKLPRIVFDMQRPIPVRRTYPHGHPNAPVSHPGLSVESTQISS